MPTDRITLPSAHKVAADMVLELQAELMVGALLRELYTYDDKRDLWRWGKDVPFGDVEALVEKLTKVVVYGQ